MASSNSKNPQYPKASNFFSDIPQMSSMMTSMSASNSSQNLFQEANDINNQTITNNLLVNEVQTSYFPVKGNEVTLSATTSDSENNQDKSEPHVCRIFAQNVTVPNKENSNYLASTNNSFFDMLPSQILPSVTSIGSVSSVTGDLNTNLLNQSPFDMNDVYNLKGSSGEADRRKDAWILSASARRGLIAAATAIPGTFFPDRELLTMPGVVLEEDMMDSVTQAVGHYLGEAEANQRKVLTVRDVTQDERGLRDLIQAECFRAAVNLTGRLLSIYGQGVGRIGQPSKHTVHSIQLWFTRLSLLLKLKEFSVLETEGSVWWDCDHPDLYYQFYPELYGGRLGTLIPFQMRLLLATIPSYCNKHHEALERLFSILAIVRKILYNLDHDRSEDGSQIEITPQDRVESKQLWKAREKRVQHVIVNIALQQKDYWLAVEVLENLVCKETNLVCQRSLKSAVGRIFLQLGDIAGAEKCFQQANLLKPSTIGTLSNHIADFRALMDQGLMAVAKNQFQEAHENFQKASLIEPSNIMVRNNIATCLLYQGHLVQSICVLSDTVNNNANVALHDNLLLNLCTLYELESSHSSNKKLELLKLVSKHKGDAFNIDCLKLI